MDSEFQMENKDGPLNKKWENIKSAIKNAAYASFTSTEKRVPGIGWINKKIVILMEEIKKFKNKNIEKRQQKYC